MTQPGCTAEAWPDDMSTERGLALENDAIEAWHQTYGSDKAPDKNWLIGWVMGALGTAPGEDA